MNWLSNNFVESIIIAVLGAGLCVLSYWLGKDANLSAAGYGLITLAAGHLGNTEVKPPAVEPPVVITHVS